MNLASPPEVILKGTTYNEAASPVLQAAQSLAQRNLSLFYYNSHMQRPHLFLALALGTLLGCSNTMEPETSDEAQSNASITSSTSQAQDNPQSSAAAQATANLAVHSIDNVQSAYNLSNGSYSLVFSSLSIEEKATAIYTGTHVCGIQFDYATNPSDLLEFQIDSQRHLYYAAYAKGTYSAALPCGTHTLTWIVTRTDEDGVPYATVKNIQPRVIHDSAYAPQWSFESGWPSDLT